MVDVVGVVIFKYIVDECSLKGDLSCVDEDECVMLIDLDDDVDLLFRCFWWIGIYCKCMLECFGLIWMCCCVIDLVYNYVID